VARNTDFVQSLARGLAVIRAFDDKNRALTVSDAARRTGLTRATARRLLLTLAELGYTATDGRVFTLRPRVLELGYAYLSSTGLAETARPHLERLVAAVHESSSLAVLDGADITYVARVATRRIMTVDIDVGTRFPAYCTAMGRVLLAGRPERWLEDYYAQVAPLPLTARTVTDVVALRGLVQRAARDGWAVVDQELELGLRSIAVPVRDRAGTVVAALNLSVHTSRGDLDEARAELLGPLLATATAIERDLAAS
jgi:IclR family transcriptional regulator, pca regulon regulatory protein